MQNAAYVLAAEFDIDRGSCLRHAIPCVPPGYDEHILAEWMLPDGAHNRSEDWTLFFLNREMPKKTDKKSTAGSGASSGSALKSVPVSVLRFNEASQEWQMTVGSNFGAEVVVDSSPPVLRILIDGRVHLHCAVSDDMQFTVLQPTFASFYAEDGTAVGLLVRDPADLIDLMQRLTAAPAPGPVPAPSPADTAAAASAAAAPTAAVAATAAGSQTEGDAGVETRAPPAGPFLFCLNCVHTLKDPGVPRGARVCAVAVATELQFFNVFRPLLVLALTKFFSDASEAPLRALYEALNSLRLHTLPNYSPALRAVARNSFVDRGLAFHSTVVAWDAAPVPLRIPLFLAPDDVSIGVQQPAVRHLVTRFRDRLAPLYNAVLLERRVLFVGYGVAAHDVCAAVLAACLLVAPPLEGILRARAFPYTNLFDLDFLEVPGYIAGTTNPMFQQHPEWWDVLLDLQTGEVHTSPRTGAEADAAYHAACAAAAALDRDLLEAVVRGVEEEAADEAWVRRQFEKYTRSIVDGSRGIAVYADDETAARAQDANRLRWALLRQTRQYAQYAPTAAAVEIAQQLRPLQVRRALGADELAVLLAGLVAHLRSEEDIIELLAQCPESDGGLQPLVVCVLHPAEVVRSRAAALCRALDASMIGRQFLSALNFFLLLAYERAVRRAPPTASP